ncbi:sulfite exporter TauE/SafE family protein [Roseateles sp. SL47]|uniref:sulfite exporter TauE/SafE family protein n=1 Tax=Roseateles sp. SL47 TaxID=2995138 RepID=UPI0022716F19|nr:sulfite exporter TauE/SafE family protein [Roseateles sp. SL47]WAC73067.1 sulfite exporter TauE/SafE family protein [Roseateles sp. SL47]
MDQLTVVVIGAICAGFVQGLSGFAFGLTAMSFWAWSLDPKTAATLAVFGALTGQLIAAVTVRRGFDWKRLAPFLMGGLVGIPIGVAILPAINIQVFKAILGGFLVIWCPAMLLAQRLPRITHGGRLADAVIGGIGGVMGGLGGFTGTVPTLWCTLRGLPKDEQRSIIQNFNLSALLVTMAVYLSQGLVTREVVPLFAIVAPAMVVPTLLGNKLYIGISEARFRQLVLALLTCSGVALLVSSIPVLVR